MTTTQSPIHPPTLLLDVGNTNIKWGILHHDQWQDKGELPTTQWRSLESIATGHGITEALGTSVAGDEINQGIERMLQTRWIKSGTPHGMIESPYDMSQLGPDRWAGLLGAHALHKGNLIVVQSGTATTVDALVDSQHLGGFILPGITLMKTALKQGTAKLNHTEGQFTPFPLNTPDAITTGTLMATLGAIHQMARQLETLGYEDLTCILSGGGAQGLQPHLRLPIKSEENLVLEGLRTLFNRIL
jgi:type III pantothenate kinase